MIWKDMPAFRKGEEMDLIFLLAVLFIIGCFIWRKKLGIFLHSRKQAPQELPLQQKESPEDTAYKILAYNARDYKDTKELESVMELRLEKCLVGLARQGVRYEVSFYSTGFVLVYLIRYWH